MATISYDDKAFIVGNHRIWIVAGAIHYFRVPRELWRDRLLKLKRAGCNTVETYVAWNFHERREGCFDFAGDADLDAFLTLAEELGLWIIVRPGPYICSEWDNGGIPAWLNAKPGVKLREANGVYHEHIRRWFERLVPVIAAHQVTRGGRVILVQDENEYCFRNRPGGREHLKFLRDLMRELGIDVPIVVCNHLHARIPGTIECWNCWEGPDRAIETLRKVQRAAPKLITEFWNGSFGVWGQADIVERKAPREVHANSLRVLAAGGMYSYYMFCGGTNFGDYPGRTWRGDDVYATTSYDSDAPLGESGALTDKYYSSRLASTLASNLESFFAESEPDALAVRSSDDVDIVTRAAGRGRVIFVFNRSRRKTARLRLPGSVSFEVSFRDHDALALPYNFSPVAGFTIEHSNLSILGMMPMGVGRLVFLHAPRGTNAVLSAQGRRFKRKVSRGAQVWFGNFPNLVAVLDTAQAARTWFLGDRTVVGADFAAEAEGERVTAACRGEGGNIVTYFPNGKVRYAACGPPAPLESLPKLSGWKKRPLLPQRRPPGAARIDSDGRFSPPETLGYFGGYGWYHTRLTSNKRRVEKMLITDGEDRLTVFVNGTRAGTYGRGAGASTGLVELPLAKGPNDLHILLDNLGRANFTLALGETKGIRGPVYLGARGLRPVIKWTAGRYNGKLAKTWQIETWWPNVKGVAATLGSVFSVEKGEGAVFRVSGIGEPAALFVNRRFHSYYWGAQVLAKSDIVLPPASLEAGRNLVELAFFVRPPREVAGCVSVYAFREEKVVRGPWYFAPLEAPKARRTAQRARPGAPIAWETTFKLKDPPAPVFLVTEGLKKGEVWLNGRMVGRHWDIGPQDRLYLPEPWFKGANRLVVVDEFGTRPSKVRLEYDAGAMMRYELL